MSRMGQSNFATEAREYLCIHNLALCARWEILVSKVGGAKANYYRCVQSEFQMGHSERLLEVAIEVAAKAGKKSMEKYFCEHLLEEKGHHKWAVSDLSYARRESVGCLRPEVHAAVRHMVGIQYQNLAAGELREYYGYLVVLEGFPGSAKYWQNFPEKHGLDVRGFTSPIRHAQIDTDHAAELYEQIADEFASAADRGVILRAAVRVFGYLLETYALENVLPTHD